MPLRSLIVVLGLLILPSFTPAFARQPNIVFVPEPDLPLVELLRRHPPHLLRVQLLQPVDERQIA